MFGNIFVNNNCFKFPVTYYTEYAKMCKGINAFFQK